MKLEIKNFGKIKEAKIYLDGITVITGENNTGKRIIEKILYCLCHTTKDQILKSFQKEFGNNYIIKNQKASFMLCVDTQSIEVSFDSKEDKIPFHQQVIYINESIHRQSQLLEKLYDTNEFYVVDESIRKMIMDVIHGSLVVKHQQIIFQDVPFDHLSLGIKSFAIVIVLRLLENGSIKEGTCLILDEPEIHLHPKWQLKYDKILIILQKTLNLHILMNSYSPYFIDAIELYSKKYDIWDKCHFYLADLCDHISVFEHVDKNIRKIYDQLAEPFDILIKRFIKTGSR